MNSIDHVPSGDIFSHVLQQVLQAAFDAERGGRRRIVRLDRTASPYGSSFPLEDVRLQFDDGTRLDLIFKIADPRALSAEARRAKPVFLDDPLREIELYRGVLDARTLGTAICYASVADPAAERYWLFLEKVAGRELYQVGEFALWRQAARWLALLHSRFAEAASVPPAARERLIRHDAAYYQRWLDRALAFGDHPLLRKIAGIYPRLVDELTALPSTLIHGEFYASNVLVRDSSESPRLCAVDWERAAWGPGGIDVAALTAGKWTESEKTELALEYHAALQASRGAVATRSEFLRGWHLCRLHLAVQWLGWSSDWSPPREHRQDWLAEAAESVNRLASSFQAGLTT